MTKFKLHTIETSPEKSKKTLEQVKNKYGMIPNLLAVLSESPETLKAYLELSDLFGKTSLDKDELTIVWQTLNVENQCHYCVPAHTAIAHAMGVDPELNNLLRNKEPMPNEKYQILQDTVLLLSRNRGYISEEEKQKFFSVGYKEQQLLEIILGMSQKLISNYVNHVAETPLDSVYAKFK